MSAPLPIGCAEHRNHTERKKHRAKSVSIPPPKQRLRRTATGRRAKRGRATWRPFLLPIRRGSDEAAPLARVDGLEPLMLAFPASGRQATFLGATGPRATRPEETRRGASLVGQGRLVVSTVGKKGLH